jgi:hypothetical protein
MSLTDPSPSSSTAFRRKQRAIGFTMALAAAITVFVLGIAFSTLRSEALALHNARLEYTLLIDLFIVAWLLATIANVARLRFFSERDIGADVSEGESSKVLEARAILQNTLEQVILVVLTSLVVTASFNPSAPLVESLVGLFAVGRLLFWLGYRHGAKGRALGFGLTFYPSAIALVASATVIAAP